MWLSEVERVYKKKWSADESVQRTPYSNLSSLGDEWLRQGAIHPWALEHGPCMTVISAQQYGSTTYREIRFCSLHVRLIYLYFCLFLLRAHRLPNTH